MCPPPEDHDHYRDRECLCFYTYVQVDGAELYVVRPSVPNHHGITLFETPNSMLLDTWRKDATRSPMIADLTRRLAPCGQGTGASMPSTRRLWRYVLRPSLRRASKAGPLDDHAEPDLTLADLSSAALRAWGSAAAI